MIWSRTHTLLAGLGLLAVTNTVALLGVAYNRRGEPEATLRLTQRELRMPYPWYGNRENSGLSLEPIWRVLDEGPTELQFNAWRYAGVGGTPAWLDKAKMAELGFDISTPAAYSDEGQARYTKQLPREVLLVLELDGATYQRSLELAKQYVAREEAKLASSPGYKNLDTRTKNAREAVEWERFRNSRLFVVDAGLDLTMLRAKYPDKTRYAIVRGQIRPQILGRQYERIGGYVSGLSVKSINVPFALRGVFGAPQVNNTDPRNRAPFEATVVFGTRLEPWITEASKK
jgi:hypothetical protein